MIVQMKEDERAYQERLQEIQKQNLENESKNKEA